MVQRSNLRHVISGRNPVAGRMWQQAVRHEGYEKAMSYILLSAPQTGIEEVSMVTSPAMIALTPARRLLFSK